ncbi:MAG TPA: metallophosphoesterase [Gemmatimonadaceae bacterium]|nr:metallophosphoesterase [Gemmatimonadaceae bacterium]
MTRRALRFIWVVLLLAGGTLTVCLQGCSLIPPRVQSTPPPATAPAEAVKIAGASVLLGVGDIASCGSRLAEATAKIADSILKADSIAKVDDAVFTLGDNAYGSGTEQQFAECFTASWGNPNRRMMKKMHPSPGNHEYLTDVANPYYKYFGAAAGEKGRGYYSYDVGQWHIVVLNSELIVDVAFASTEQKLQMEWLAKDLVDHKKDCTIAYWHHPRFSSGWHGSDWHMIPLWQVLYDNNVDVVLTGHDHHYERFLPMTAQGVLDTLRGIPSYVVGTGGEDLRGLGTIQPNSVTRIQGHAGILLLTLGAKEYRSAFVDSDGRVWDETGGKCH